MKTYGVIYKDGTKDLVSIVLDEQGEPRMDTLRPYPCPEDWEDPTIVPLIKIEKPSEGEFNPIVVWFEDRVERQWEQA
jgi:hypothetical protein